MRSRIALVREGLAYALRRLAEAADELDEWNMILVDICRGWRTPLQRVGPSSKRFKRNIRMLLESSCAYPE